MKMGTVCTVCPILDTEILKQNPRFHRSKTLLCYNQCNGGYDKFVTAGTISFNGGFTLEKKRGRMDWLKI